MKYIYISSLFLFTNIVLSFFVVESCTENSGVAFGIEIEYVSLVSILLLIDISILALKVKGNLRHILFSIVILGSGNLLERILRGYICDYIPLLNLSINILDIGIVVLTILGVLICIFNKG